MKQKLESLLTHKTVLCTASNAKEHDAFVACNTFHWHIHIWLWCRCNCICFPVCIPSVFIEIAQLKESNQCKFHFLRAPSGWALYLRIARVCVCACRWIHD